MKHFASFGRKSIVVFLMEPMVVYFAVLVGGLVAKKKPRQIK